MFLQRGLIFTHETVREWESKLAPFLGDTLRKRLENAPPALAKKQHLVGEWHDRGNAALGVMNTHLKTHDWFGGPRYSIADIALYGYTHCAADGGFELSEYPAVVKWLARVAAEPGHIPLDESW